MTALVTVSIRDVHPFLGAIWYAVAPVGTEMRVDDAWRTVVKLPTLQSAVVVCVEHGNTICMP